MNMTPSKRVYLLITGLLVTIILAGCNLPGSGDADDTGLMATLARQTVSAKLTQAILETQIASDQQPEASATSTPEGSATPENTPTQQYTNTPGPTPTNTPIPCNWAQFVDDVTIPDNTELVAGTVFTKTWRLKNIGTCDWTSGYRLIFDGGNQMNAPDNTQFTTGTVPPGATVDISVELTAPATPGTNVGYFKLRSSDNIVFGTGANAEGNFWIKIVVLAPSATPTATSTSTETPTATFTPTATATTAAQPDLIITAITLNPDPPTKGQPVVITVEIKNQGNEIAVGPFKVTFYPDTSDLSQVCEDTRSDLVAGATTTITCNYTYLNDGNIVGKAEVDNTNTVPESNEGNNEMLKDIIVNP